MSTQEKIRWREKGNPYEVVREDTTEEVCYGDLRVTTIGFDAKDRKVMHRTEVFHPDGSYGIWCRVVEADGYWHGGVGEYDAEGNHIGGCIECLENLMKMKIERILR